MYKAIKKLETIKSKNAEIELENFKAFSKNLCWIELVDPINKTIYIEHPSYIRIDDKDVNKICKFFLKQNKELMHINIGMYSGMSRVVNNSNK